LEPERRPAHRLVFARSPCVLYSSSSKTVGSRPHVKPALHVPEMPVHRRAALNDSRVNSRLNSALKGRRNASRTCVTYPCVSRAHPELHLFTIEGLPSELMRGRSALHSVYFRLRERDDRASSSPRRKCSTQVSFKTCTLR